jgi:murein DD-endopeptidase MepM/ murein hydrolase activator NlpD
MRESWRNFVGFCTVVGRKNTIRTLVLSLLIIIPGACVIYAYGPQEVMVNGQVLGVAANREAVSKALDEVISEKSQSLGGQKVELVDQLIMKRKLFVSEGADQSELVGLLADLNFAVKAVAIKVNGETCVKVASEEEAQAALEQIKMHYAQPGPGEEIKGVSIAEEVSFEPVPATTGEILSISEAVERIQIGTDEMITYKVKEGDNLWSIARAHDLRVNDLMQANPDMKSEKLSLGQVLRVVSPTPLISVLVTIEKTASEAVSFPVEIKTTDQKLRGYQKVEQEGVPGSREVIYQIVRQNELTIEESVLQEALIKEPIKQVVIQGTQVAVASRGSSESYSSGSGRLAWPLRGSITSGFGPRSGGYHTGMDINGNTGDAIRAAEDGKVTATGWEGGYGNLITIDHGGGMITRYAHCSAINVSRGDKVSQGQVIGRVGSTGRSTGSHLHFEVLVGGNTVNPAKYLR